MRRRYRRASDSLSLPLPRFLLEPPPPSLLLVPRHKTRRPRLEPGEGGGVCVYKIFTTNTHGAPYRVCATIIRPFVLDNGVESKVYRILHCLVPILRAITRDTLDYQR